MTLDSLIAERDRINRLIETAKADERTAHVLERVPTCSRAAISEIRRVMKERGVTTSDLAVKLGAKRQAAHQWVSGHNGQNRGVGMTLRTLHKVASALDHDVQITLVPKGAHQ
jgi:DNA-binding transcriptional regulator YiaG